MKYCRSNWKNSKSEYANRTPRFLKDEIHSLYQIRNIVRSRIEFINKIESSQAGKLEIFSENQLSFYRRKEISLYIPNTDNRIGLK